MTMGAFSGVVKLNTYLSTLLAHHDTLRANERSGAMRQAGSRHHER